MDANKLMSELRRDESFVSHGYTDHLGYLTIGIGRLIDQRKGGGITEAEALYLLGNDVQKVYAQLHNTLPWFGKLSDALQRALCNMAFQMGIDGLLGFKNTLDMIRIGNYKAAAANARLSKWYSQTPERAERVIALILEG